MLDENLLWYYEMSWKGKIPVRQGLTVVASTPSPSLAPEQANFGGFRSQSQFAFRINLTWGDNRVTRVAADSEADQTYWIDALKAVLQVTIRMLCVLRVCVCVCLYLAEYAFACVHQTGVTRHSVMSRVVLTAYVLLLPVLQGGSGVADDDLPDDLLQSPGTAEVEAPVGQVTLVFTDIQVMRD